MMEEPTATVEGEDMMTLVKLTRTHRRGFAAARKPRSARPGSASMRDAVASAPQARSFQASGRRIGNVIALVSGRDRRPTVCWRVSWRNGSVNVSWPLGRVVADEDRVRKRHLRP